MAAAGRKWVTMQLSELNEAEFKTTKNTSVPPGVISRNLGTNACSQMVTLRDSNNNLEI